LTEPTPLSARARESPLAHQSTPELNVRVYSFAGLSPWVLQGAEIEAVRMLRTVPISIQLD